MTLARVFVAVAYLILGVSFVASTGLLIQEFQGTDWRSMIIAHSHIFLFFPVFGILALAAFYLPSVVFMDLYWRHLPYGKLRFLAGLVALAAISYGVAWWLDAKPRAVWEVSPRALAADRGDPAGCGAGAGSAPCRRAPILATLASLRKAGQTRVGLSKFARSCEIDPMLETPEEMEKERHCFPADARLKAAACCEVQKRFGDEVARLQADPAQRSLVAVYEAIFLPLRIFFVLIVIAIGLLLAAWRDRIDLLYREIIPAVERGVIIGAFAMLFWPAMDYGYQATADVLFGRTQSGPHLRLSLVIAPWALLLLFYFLRRLGRQGEMIGQIAGVVTAGVAVLRYEDLNDWAVRLVGVGSQEWMIAGLLLVALAGFVALVWPWRSHLAAQPMSSTGS
ncbi:MAG: hypothetical protein E6G91_17715 [Alphaproteobacteria bacterium]|nr:MAG: hypothetical protein E6G91_17715 [Alphaproteobacteria bacterium]